MASWGRHGWARKDEGLRIYRDRDSTYFLIDPDARTGGGYDGVANVLRGEGPSLGSCTISADWMYKAGVKRVQWSEVPQEWQDALRKWLDKQPEEYRGFWLVGQQPQA